MIHVCRLHYKKQNSLEQLCTFRWNTIVTYESSMSIFGVTFVSGRNNLELTNVKIIVVFFPFIASRSNVLGMFHVILWSFWNLLTWAGSAMSHNPFPFYRRRGRWNDRDVQLLKGVWRNRTDRNSHIVGYSSEVVTSVPKGLSHCSARFHINSNLLWPEVFPRAITGSDSQSFS